MAEGAGRTIDPVVSSETEELILVDESDREVGHASKADCHDGDGLLHRAFSIFVFNSRGELLMQQRSPEKRLWPLYWSNSCCSHPRRGETMERATRRRLQQELGIAARLEHLFTFTYHARFRDLGSEREMCWVYAGSSDAKPSFNTHEIAAIRWIPPADLDRELSETPDRFTPWFKQEWPRVKEGLRLGA